MDFEKFFRAPLLRKKVYEKNFFTNPPLCILPSLNNENKKASLFARNTEDIKVKKAIKDAYDRSNLWAASKKYPKESKSPNEILLHE